MCPELEGQKYDRIIMYSETNNTNYRYNTAEMERLRTSCALFSSGYPEDALDTLRSIEDDSYRDCEEYYKQELCCLIRLERFEEAEKLSLSLIDRFGHMSESPWLALVSSLQALGREEEACAALEETISYWPNDPRLLKLLIGNAAKENG